MTQRREAAAAHPWLVALHLGYGLVLPVAGLLLPLFLIPLAVGGGLVAAAVAWGLSGRPPLPGRAALLLALATLGWSAAAIAWSFDPPSAFGRWANLPLLLLAALPLLGAAPAYPGRLTEALLRGLLVGFCLGALVILVEWKAGAPLVQFTRGPQDTLSRALGELNRGLGLAALLIWAPVGWLAARGRRSAWLLPLLLLPPTLLLQNLASALAILAGYAFAGVALAWPRLGRALVLAVPLLLALLGPWLFVRLHAWGLMESASLPSTARYRVQIWWFVSERIQEKPLWGWGFDASRRMPDFGVEPYGGKPKVIPTHPHQAFLQAWMELGLPGLLLLLGWFALGWRALRRLEGALLAAGCGLAGGLIAVLATAYGLWQGHTLAILVLAVGIFCLVPALRHPGQQAGQQAGQRAEAGRQAHREAGAGQR